MKKSIAKKAQTTAPLSSHEESIEDASVPTCTSTSADASVPTPALSLASYMFTDEEIAKAAELKITSHVNKRFFRFNKDAKGRVPELIEKIETVIRFTRTSRKLYQEQLDDKDTFATGASAYAERAIILDGYSSRTVVIALIKILNKVGYIPTVAFKIGPTCILCESAPSARNKGNVNLQVIDAEGAKIFIPSVYGDGNGKPHCSISEKLKKIAGSNKPAFFRQMREARHVISSVERRIPSDSHLINQVNLLHAIIEVARRCYFESTSGAKKLSELPLGVAQARTSALLINDKITIDNAYGLDTSNPPIYQGKAAREQHKAPYGALTGKTVDQHVDIVKEKIIRINEKYNSSTDDGAFIIEGRRRLREFLSEEYGSDSESSGADYSDSESEIEELEDATRVELTR